MTPRIPKAQREVAIRGRIPTNVLTVMMHAKGFTAAAFAKKMKLSTITMHNYATYGVPAARLEQFAEALGVPVQAVPRWSKDHIPTPKPLVSTDLAALSIDALVQQTERLDATFHSQREKLQADLAKTQATYATNIAALEGAHASASKALREELERRKDSLVKLAERLYAGSTPTAEAK